MLCLPRLGLRSRLELASIDKLIQPDMMASSVLQDNCKYSKWITCFIFSIFSCSYTLGLLLRFYCAVKVAFHARLSTVRSLRGVACLFFWALEGSLTRRLQCLRTMDRVALCFRLLVLPLILLAHPLPSAPSSPFPSTKLVKQSRRSLIFFLCSLSLSWLHEYFGIINGQFVSSSARLHGHNGAWRGVALTHNYPLQRGQYLPSSMVSQCVSYMMHRSFSKSVFV